MAYGLLNGIAITLIAVLGIWVFAWAAKTHKKD